jgi:CPA1 family monovalent cation:H+ antiporter
MRRTTSSPARPEAATALTRSLPAGPQRDTVLALTYCTVVFSILGQGLSIGPVVHRAVTARR